MTVALDRSKLYFFHNVYGDEQNLLDTMPANVVAVPVGWTEEVEAARNEILDAMVVDGEGIGGRYSTIPDVLYFRPSFTKTELDADGQPIIIEVNAHWASLRLDVTNLPESWDIIEARIENNIANNTF